MENGRLIRVCFLIEYSVGYSGDLAYLEVWGRGHDIGSDESYKWRAVPPGLPAASYSHV